MKWCVKELMTSSPAHMDLEHMKDIHSELGSIPNVLQTLHKNEEDGESDASKSITQDIYTTCLHALYIQRTN